jgi:hypothetical protein
MLYSYCTRTIPGRTYGSIAQAGVFAQIVMVKDLEEELVA